MQFVTSGADLFGGVAKLLSTSLNRGAAEGDLMELNGWSSPQMLARYGRSVRSVQARRHYDDIKGG